METINVLIGVAGLLLTVFIALIPYIKKVYFVGPELTVEVFPDGGSSGNRGYSSKNNSLDSPISVEDAIHIFEVTWKIKIRITNNSNLIAYYPEIGFYNHQLGFSSIDKLDRNKPIKENEQIILNATYKIFEECTGRDRTHVKGLPDHLNNLKIILKYFNPSKKPFYTIYSHSKLEKQNIYTRIKPAEFKKTNNSVNNS